MINGYMPHPAPVTESQRIIPRHDHRDSGHEISILFKKKVIELRLLLTKRGYGIFFGDCRQPVPDVVNNEYFCSVEKRFRGSLLLPPLLRHQSLEGDGALLAMAREQVI